MKRENEKDEEFCLTLVHFTPQITPMTEAGPRLDKARSLELHLSFPHWWEGPKCLSHLQLPYGYVSNELDWNQSQGLL